MTLSAARSEAAIKSIIAVAGDNPENLKRLIMDLWNTIEPWGQEEIIQEHEAELGKLELPEMKHPDIAADLLLAHRFLYYVMATPVLPDADYDDLEAQHLEFAEPDDPIRKPGSDRKEDYHPSIRGLAIYLSLRFATRPVVTSEPKTAPSTPPPPKKAASKPTRTNSAPPDGALF